MSFKKDFFDALKSEFAPRLREEGFSGSGQNFRRVRDEIINTINVQGYTYGEKCTLNIGLHCTFLPTSSEELPDVRTIKEIDCEFRARVAPGGESEFWWEYGNDATFAHRSARHLTDTYFAAGEPKFHRFSSLKSIAAMYPIESLGPDKAGDARDTAFGYLPCTIPRIALSMARIHEYLGNLALAREFAAKGLEHLGRGTTLAPLLQRIVAKS